MCINLLIYRDTGMLEKNEFFKIYIKYFVYVTGINFSTWELEQNGIKKRLEIKENKFLRNVNKRLV